MSLETRVNAVKSVLVGLARKYALVDQMTLAIVSSLQWKDFMISVCEQFDKRDEETGDWILASVDSAETFDDMLKIFNRSVGSSSSKSDLGGLDLSALDPGSWTEKETAEFTRNIRALAAEMVVILDCYEMVRRTIEKKKEQ